MEIYDCILFIRRAIYKKSFVVVNIPSLYESLGSALCYRKQISPKVVAQLFNSG